MRTRSATEQVVADPLAPTGPNGWSPAEIRYVDSKAAIGFGPAALQFSQQPVQEQPGQRLSQGMVDQLAPYYASTFQVDEQQVRNVLAEVYLYIGGPNNVPWSATTTGTHIFVPARAELEMILGDSTEGKRWLVHEIAHVMQFAVYDGRSMYNAASDYARGMLLAHNPERGGTGSGPAVWGALFTGIGLAEQATDGFNLGKGSASLADKLQVSLLPAAALGLPAGMVAGAAIDGWRHWLRKPVADVAVSNLVVPRHLNGILSGAVAVAAPALIGGLAGAAVDQLGQTGSELTGAVGGAVAAGLGTWLLQRGLRGGAASPMGWAALAPVVAAAAFGALEGGLVARTSANTIRGWSNSWDLLAGRDIHAPRPANYGASVHDAHWREIDAEAVAQNFIHPDPAAPIDAERFTGIDLPRPSQLRQRSDWSLLNPVIAGAPAAVGASLAVGALRLGRLAVRDAFAGHGLAERLRLAQQSLGSSRMGIANSIGVGTAVTAIPLLTGGIVGGLSDALGAPKLVSQVLGSGAAMAATGVHLTWLLRGGSGSGLQTALKVAAGMAIAAPLGWFTASTSAAAAQPWQRTYDVAPSAQ